MKSIALLLFSIVNVVLSYPEVNNLDYYGYYGGHSESELYEFFYEVPCMEFRGVEGWITGDRASCDEAIKSVRNLNSTLVEFIQQIEVNNHIFKNYKYVNISFRFRLLTILMEQAA